MDQGAQALPQALPHALPALDLKHAQQWGNLLASYNPVVMLTWLLNIAVAFTTGSNDLPPDLIAFRHTLSKALYEFWNGFSTSPEYQRHPYRTAMGTVVLTLVIYAVLRRVGRALLARSE